MDVTELAFEDKLMDAAVRFGWRVHIERAVTVRRDEDGESEATITPVKGHSGWFDVSLAHPKLGVVLAELKTEKGRIRPDQQDWQNDCAAHDVPGSPLLVELWRPADWPYIEVLLREGVHVYRARYRTPGTTEPGCDP